MEAIRGGILFCYMLALFLGVGALTMALLVGKKNSNKYNKALTVFLSGMLVMSLYDMLIYYMDYQIGPFDDFLALRIGSSIIAILFYLWLRLECEISDGDSLSWFNRMTRIYVILYALLWVVLGAALSYDYIYMIRWLLLVTDIILLLILLAGSVAYMGKALLTEKSRGSVYYMIVVTAMLAWNYSSFFWGEASRYWGNGTFVREPLDLTIIFWFIVNTSTLIFVYKKNFVEAYENKNTIEGYFDLNERMEEIARKYEMTKREKDLCRLVYEGKSNMQIAQALFISESTVKTHVYNIFRKMGVKNRVGLTRVVRGETQE